MTIGFCKTSGQGFWSNSVQNVPIEGLELCYISPTLKLADLRVYFDISVWDIEKLGLIYTDPQWIKDLRQLLQSIGFSPEATQEIGYSAQGCQRENYVCLDVGPTFVRESLANISDVVKVNVRKY